VWKSERYEFTPWLRENISLLGKALGLEIDVDVQREVTVGMFSADLVGTDLGSNASILVENQLEQTDHSHLGQLITYAAGLGTDVIVWVSTKVREEHRQAFLWLNEKTHEDMLFFAVEIELLQIDGSKPAPHFKVVVSPNEWQKSGAPASNRTQGRGLSTERGERYKEFWRGLLAEILDRDAQATTASSERVPAQSWYGISIGRSGFLDNFVFGWDGPEAIVRAELYVDVGAKEHNEAIFDAFLADREAIEREFGEPLHWDRREDVKMCRIYVRRAGSIKDADEVLAELQVWGADRLLRIRKVFGPRAKSLDLNVLAASAAAEAPPGEEGPA